MSNMRSCCHWQISVYGVLRYRFSSSFVTGEICGFRVHSGPLGSGTAQFEAVVLDRSTGEGLVRSKEPLDCESQREHSFTIQAYDCGEGPDGVNSKKSHKLVF